MAGVPFDAEERAQLIVTYAGLSQSYLALARSVLAATPPWQLGTVLDVLRQLLPIVPGVPVLEP